MFNTKVELITSSLTNVQFVLISLSGWGLLFYSGYKLATGGSKEVLLALSQALLPLQSSFVFLPLYMLFSFESLQKPVESAQ